MKKVIKFQNILQDMGLVIIFICHLLLSTQVVLLFFQNIKINYLGNMSKFIMEPGNAFTIEPIIFLHEPKLSLMQWSNNFTVIQNYFFIFLINNKVVAPFTPSA